uniref:Uncharacterized protein n=1 Tax=viral metagenome TaxID=1070528 RepID=A0A6C0DIG5_9ZZZZ
MTLLQLLELIIYLYLYCNVSIHGNNKLCKNCKNFIPYKNNQIDGFGLCKLFGTKKSHVDTIDKTKIIFEFADHCRENENFCGETGIFYESIHDSTSLQYELDKKTTYVENNTTTNPSKKYVEKKLDDDIKTMINDYYNYIRNDNDW